MLNIYETPVVGTNASSQYIDGILQSEKYIKIA